MNQNDRSIPQERLLEYMALSTKPCGEISMGYIGTVTLTRRDPNNSMRYPQYMKHKPGEVPVIPDGVLLEWCTLCNHAIFVCKNTECNWCSCNGAHPCQECEPLSDLMGEFLKLGIRFTRDEVEAQPGYVLPHERELDDNLRQAIELYGRRGLCGELNYKFYALDGRVYRLREYANRWEAEVYMGHIHWRSIGNAFAYQIISRGASLESVNDIEKALKDYDVSRFDRDE